MSEARMFGTGKDEVPDAELPNPPKPLDLRSLDQIHDQVLRYGDEPVHRVGEYFESAGHASKISLFHPRARPL